MTAKLLMWVLGALFALCGLPLLIVENAEWQRIWGSLSTGSLGGFALAMAYDAVGTGKLRFQHSLIERGRQPGLFWAAVSLIIVTGAIVIAGAVWMAFFKGR